jgi:ubiquinone/menaquinone biosynthesis C-methylase UbiE
MQATIKSSVECPDVSTYLPLLRTPGGAKDLLIRGSGLQARDSSDEYPLVDGIPVLSPVEHHKVVATDVQEYYDKEAAVYNNTHGSELRGTQYNIEKHYGRLFEKYVRGSGTVLEFGAGTGRFTKVFKPMVRSLIATDFSMPMLLKARGIGVPLVCADTQALPFASNTFDLLVGITTFSYVPNKAKAMAEFRRVLKPNGRLLMLDQNFGGFVMYLVSGYYFQSRKKTRPTEVKESTITNYKRLFQENSFTVDQTEVFSWVPHTVQAVGTKLYGVLDSVFSHVPVLRGQAMRLFITGRVQK